MFVTIQSTSQSRKTERDRILNKNKKKVTYNKNASLVHLLWHGIILLLDSQCIIDETCMCLAQMNLNYLCSWATVDIHSFHGACAVHAALPIASQFTDLTHLQLQL